MDSIRKETHVVSVMTNSYKESCAVVRGKEDDRLLLHKCFFRYVEAEEKPSKKSKKDGAKGLIALLKESAQLGFVSQDSYPRRSTPRERGKLGSKHAVKFSKGTWHKIKNREKKGSITRNCPKV